MTVKGLRVFQWGEEAASGTAVAATSKMAVRDIEFDPIDAPERPPLARGLLTRHPGSETIVIRGTRFRVAETEVVYDDQHIWASIGIKGGVVATGTNPYTWTTARSLTADPAIKTRTVERRITDGTTPTDNEWAYCHLSKMRWIYRRGQTLKFAAEGVGRRIQGSTLTAAQAMPTTEHPVSPLVTAYIDTTWAGIGGTQVLAQVLGADITFHTGLTPLDTFDGRTDLDFTTVVLDADQVGLDVELALRVGAQFATEKTAAEAQSLRAVRFKVLGTSSKELTLDMLLKHEPGSIQKIGEQDGQDIVVVKLTDATDGTNLFQHKVVNAAATTA